MSKDLVKFERAVNGEWPTVPKNASLDDLENIVRYELYEGFVKAGAAMEKILAGRLYEQRGYESQKEYFDSGTAPCKQRHAAQLVAAASLRVKLGKPSATALSWTERALRPLTSIQPKSQAVRLAKEAQKAAKAADENEVKSVYVNRVLAAFKGKFPKAKKAKAKALELADTPAEAVEFARQRVEELHGVFEKFNASMWEDAEADDPGCVKRLAQVCSALASFLRS